MAINDVFVNRRKELFSLLSMRKGLEKPKDDNSPFAKINLIIDEGTFHEHNRKMVTIDPLSFPGYVQKLDSTKRKSKTYEAIITGSGKIDGYSVAIGVMDNRFMMGSMGTVVGEKVTKLCEYAYRHKVPLIIFCTSGGARMQEGLFSLMQMAKTAGAIQRFKEKGGLYISILTNPTTGGVSASFASLGDIIIAEPGALICFAGPRVIEQTIGQTLPEGFQKSEFLMEHGMIDMIVGWEDMRDMLKNILLIHCWKKGKAGENNYGRK